MALVVLWLKGQHKLSAEDPAAAVRYSSFQGRYERRSGEGPEGGRGTDLVNVQTSVTG